MAKRTPVSESGPWNAPRDSSRTGLDANLCDLHRRQ